MDRVFIGKLPMEKIMRGKLGYENVGYIMDINEDIVAKKEE
jgi:hypothetical protein